MKVCPACKTEQPAENFYLHKTGRQAGRPYSYCKPCNFQKHRAHYTPEKRKNWLLKTMYGITLEEYQQMLVEQEGLCAICNEPPTPKQPYLAVDHNHNTGTVRALLCGKCNMVVGGCNESIERLQRIADYLVAHAEST